MARNHPDIDLTCIVDGCRNLVKPGRFGTCQLHQIRFALRLNQLGETESNDDEQSAPPATPAESLLATV